MRIPFNTRAETMGLKCDHAKGAYSYSDQYGEIIYRKLTTFGDNMDEPTDGQKVPLYAIYTKTPGSERPHSYCGYISDIYQFMGHDVLNQKVREAVVEVGMPVLKEQTFLTPDLTSMRTELIIQSAKTVPLAGDVLPVMIMSNSYNGTKSASLSFGIATFAISQQVVFRFGLGEMRQIHIANANTTLSSAVSSYIEVFSNDIAEMITNSFRSEITHEQMFATMDLIDNISKKRRKKIISMLSEMVPTPEGEDIPLPSAWQLFLAIVRYSSLEPNLNAKKLLENIAESVLIIPPRMYDVLNKLSS